MGHWRPPRWLMEYGPWLARKHASPQFAIALTLRAVLVLGPWRGPWPFPLSPGIIKSGPGPPNYVVIWLSMCYNGCVTWDQRPMGQWANAPSQGLPPTSQYDKGRNL